jgi:hypothetical protein
MRFKSCEHLMCQNNNAAKNSDFDFIMLNYTMALLTYETPDLDRAVFR